MRWDERRRGDETKRVRVGVSQSRRDAGWRLLSGDSCCEKCRMQLCVPDTDCNCVLLWVQKREGGLRLNGRADEQIPNVDAGRTDIVWGTVNDGPICHCVNAGEVKAPT